jgi:hypothetical protein
LQRRNGAVTAVSAEEFDRDFRRDLLDGLPDFVGGVRQPIRIDIDSNVTSETRHVFARF